MRFVIGFARPWCKNRDGRYANLRVIGNGVGVPSSMASTAARALRKPIDIPCPVNPPQNQTVPFRHGPSTGPISGMPSGEKPIVPAHRAKT